MRNLVLIAHISLDGFVAGIKGELDGFEAGEESLAFVCRLTREADAALFGRKSFELLDSHWPAAKDRPQATKGEIAYSTWYNKAQKIVFSATLNKIQSNNTILVKGNIVDETIKIREQAGRDILIFGSPSVSQVLMQHDLIDSYWIFVNPVLFGQGIPLFKGSQNRAKLILRTLRRFSNGEVALNYFPDRSSG